MVPKRRYHLELFLCSGSSRLHSHQLEQQRHHQPSPMTFPNSNLASKIPLSVGGTHKIGFLTHMAVIKNKKSTLEMAWRPSYETKSSIKNTC